MSLLVGSQFTIDACTISVNVSSGIVGDRILVRWLNADRSKIFGVINRWYSIFNGSLPKQGRPWYMGANGSNRMELHLIIGKLYGSAKFILNRLATIEELKEEIREDIRAVHFLILPCSFSIPKPAGRSMSSNMHGDYFCSCWIHLLRYKVKDTVKKWIWHNFAKKLGNKIFMKRFLKKKLNRLVCNIFKL